MCGWMMFMCHCQISSRALYAAQMRVELTTSQYCPTVAVKLYYVLDNAGLGIGTADYELLA